MWKLSISYVNGVHMILMETQQAHYIVHMCLTHGRAAWNGKHVEYPKPLPHEFYHQYMHVYVPAG